MPSLATASRVTIRWRCLVSRKRLYPNAAARVAAYRERQGLVTLSVDIPRDVASALDQFLRFKCVTKSQVIAGLIRDQLLRKR